MSRSECHYAALQMRTDTILGDFLVEDKPKRFSLFNLLSAVQRDFSHARMASAHHQFVSLHNF
jgi:hypothetical protein